MTTTFKTEQRQILQLQATPNSKHIVGERSLHYYSVKTPQKLVCLVIYNRRHWADSDIPAYIVTNSAGSIPVRQLVHAMVSKYGPPKLPNVHVDFEFDGSISEIKTWLDNYIASSSHTPVRILDTGAFCTQLNTLKANEENRAAHREVDEAVERLQREMATITANAGQNLLTAYSHGTRPTGAAVWDKQYYNFPE